MNVKRFCTRLLVTAALAGGGFASVGCGGGGGGEGGSDVFIAFPRDMAGFETWTSFDLGEDQADGVTAVGNRRAYINRLPPHGSTAFPVGTIIVKTIGEELATPGQVFAMAKRGTYNVQGAVGWEWFELVTKPSPTPPLILWRGIAPPAGETYAGIAGGACNTCHVAETGNDFVPSAELLLSQF